MTDLRSHVRIAPVGSPPDELEGWKQILACTADYLDRWFRDEPDGYDLPWQYNETAITGFVLAAIWASSRGSVALQDYVTAGKYVDEDADEASAGTRRPDLWLTLDGQCFRMEAKRSWVSAWDGLEERFLSRADAASRWALDQVRDIDESADWLGALLYLVPYIPGNKNARVSDVVAEARGSKFPARGGWRGYRLDYYPDIEHPDRTGDLYRHPGITIVANFRRR